jgi:hypothetical protein
MIRFTMRSVAVLVLSLALISTLAAPTLAAPGGNSAAAVDCENGGYLNYTDDAYNSFKNEGQCTKYAARGGTLVKLVVTSLTIAGGQTAFDGYFSGTGFTAGESVAYVTWAGADSLEKWTHFNMVIDAGGAFTSPATSWWCAMPYWYGTPLMTLTVEDSAGFSFSQAFDMATYCDLAT